MSSQTHGLEDRLGNRVGVIGSNGVGVSKQLRIILFFIKDPAEELTQ